MVPNDLVMTIAVPLLRLCFRPFVFGPLSNGILGFGISIVVSLGLSNGHLKIMFDIKGSHSSIFSPEVTAFIFCLSRKPVFTLGRKVKKKK